ncbi:uncharacterized protein LOC135828673 [Sycon ciliatum]|uniref:uncharacterized protein LOC135828673 n=1 Tax=Sycon ciliatum TaxID=27933 RepID=UPI0031F6CF52
MSKGKNKKGAVTPSKPVGENESPLESYKEEDDEPSQAMSTPAASSFVAARKSREAHIYAGVLEQDLQASLQYDDWRKMSDDDDLETTMEELSIFVDKFNDSVIVFEGVCDTLVETSGSPLLSPEVDLDKLLLLGVDCNRRISFLRSVLKQLHIRHRRNTAVVTQPTTHTNHAVSPEVKLPKLDLPKFDGSVLKSQEFFDVFVATVHDNARISDVQKLSYLRECLVGSAKEAVAGYQITDANYRVVWGVLKERYGSKQKSIHAHYTALMNLPPASNKTHSLRSLHDKLEEHLRSLAALGQDVGQDIFVSLILNKLPQHTVLQLELRKPTQWKVSSLRQAFSEYVKAKEVAEEQGAVHSESDRAQTSSQTRPKPSQNSHRSGATLLNDRQPKCHFCKESHFSDECLKYRTVEQRKERVKDQCFRCFRKEHSARDCTITRKCYYCSGPHHRSLCVTKFGQATSALNVHAEPFSPDTALISPEGNVNLQTALTEARHNSFVKPARLLFDTGASRSYITADLRSALDLPTVATESMSTATFGACSRKHQTLDVVEVEVRLSNGSLKKLPVSVVPVISSPIAKYPVDATGHPALRHLPLAEPLSSNQEWVTVDLLIGSDYYFDFILSERLNFPDGLILLQSTLGYVCTGKASSNDPKDATCFFSSSETSTIVPDANLHQFWAADEIQEPDDCRDDDARAHQAFKDSVQFEDNRYVVKWPWRDCAPPLPDNYGLAFGRLQSLYKRLSTDHRQLEKYHEVIEQQAQSGVIEEAPRYSDSKLHYLPHHGVFKTTSTTTKLRLVYDASAKSAHDAPSLNDCLHRGPVLLPDLTGVLLRFRTFPIGIISDVEKAFLQVSLAEEDRDVTRFLWVRDIHSPVSGQNLVTYRFTRVPFGVVSSPFLLAATLQHHLTRIESPQAHHILANTYVDNVVGGVSDVAAGQQYYTTAKSNFARASMNLREWSTNSEELKDLLPEGDRADSVLQQVLGTTWDTSHDTLNISDTQMSQRLVRSKRELLQALAHFYDPLGIHAPVVVKAKLILQEVWRLNLDWDDPLPNSIHDAWSTVATEMDVASTFTVPRYCSLPSAETHSLHIFCDASQSAYAAAAYLKTSAEGRDVSHLIFSKSKVAPIKRPETLTIPRMELMAAALGAKVARHLTKQLDLKFERVCLWLDSTCVLGWVRSTKKLPSFVQNRVKYINESGVECKYVPTFENPADLPSRGSTIHLSEESLWWHGPNWLIDPSISEPEFPGTFAPASHVQGEGPSEFGPASETSCDRSKKKGCEPPFGIDITRFSSLSKLIRVTAWASRFVEKCRKQERCHSTPWLSSEELRKAHVTWLKFDQRQQYAQTYSDLQDGKSNQLIVSLRLYTHEGIIRSAGRLQFADVPESARSPILLSSSSHLTTLIISETHHSLMHAGGTHTLASLRNQYWIPQGRRSIKSVLKKCVVCRRLQGGPYHQPQMPQLPSQRVTAADAFTFTGLDYFGPIYVRNPDSEVSKTWVCLFTCLVTRAGHLELVENMSAEHFVLCLRRFTARRGVPQFIVSDNAPQFKLTKSAIDKAWSQLVIDPDVVHHATSKGISWQFIVESAPWMGGVYERMVGVVKSALRKAIGNRRLLPTQLLTVLTEAEAVVNSRPLVYVGGDSGDCGVITPSHFLSLKPSLGFPPLSPTHDEFDTQFVPDLSSAVSLLQTWKRGQALVDAFWSHWRKHYLLALRERADAHSRKRGEHSMQPQVGDVVIIAEQHMPRASWKLGRVVEVHSSSDQEIRSATVRVTGTDRRIRRPVTLLYPLETMPEPATPPNITPPAEPAAPRTPVTSNPQPVARPTRRAADRCRQGIKDMKDKDLV